LPTSSPVMAAEFRLEGDDGVGSVGGRSTMLGAGETLELEDPDFMIGDSGEIIPFTPRRKVPRTPARTVGATMSGDAGASTRVRKEHEEGQQAGSQVSFAAFSHVFSHCNISPQSCGQTSLLSLEASNITPHYLTAIAQAQSIGWLWRLPVAVFAWCLFPIFVCVFRASTFVVFSQHILPSASLKWRLINTSSPATRKTLTFRPTIMTPLKAKHFCQTVRNSPASLQKSLSLLIHSLRPYAAVEVHALYPSIQRQSFPTKSWLVGKRTTGRT
jgi:hypothetical protein